MSNYYLLRHRSVPEIANLNVYRINGGFEAYTKALKVLKPEDVLGGENSGLPGRWDSFRRVNGGSCL